MSSSPEQSNSTTPQTTPHNISRILSDASMMSAASLGSGGESPPRLNQPYPSPHGNTLSPPQVLNVMSSPSSTPNSPHLGQRPSSGNLVKGMKRKFMRKTGHHPVVTHSSLPTPNLATPPREDSIDVATYHPNRALFARMLGQLQPKKMKHFRRTKRRPDKQYHSDDGYTSDPGILREEDDDETDNDPEENRRRIQELERKAEKLRRTLEEDDMSLHENDEEVESQPPASHRFKLHRGSTSTTTSKNNDAIRAKLEKVEAQLKELREGGTSRGSRLRGRVFLGIKDKLTPHGGWGKLRKKRVVVQDEEVLDDEEEEEDDGQIVEEDAIEEATPDALMAVLRVDLDTLRMACGESLEQNKKWRDDFTEQNERIEASLALLVEKFEHERERGERLEGQLNDITELHQNAVDDLRAQLTQIEHTTTNKCQDLEDAVESFQTKCDHLDVRVHKLLDSNEVPQVNHLVRRPMASLLSFVLVLIAFFLKLVSIVRTRPVLKLFLVAALLVLLYVYYTTHYGTT